jgi:hypothetical protein
MTICEWCDTEVNEQMGGECISCWALRTRIERHPEIAKKILSSISKCSCCGAQLPVIMSREKQCEHNGS